MKKKAKKEKKPKKKSLLNELETVTYEQQIVDNNRQIARLRTRNEELEAEADKLRDKLQQLEESKADLTTYLEDVLQKKRQEAQELQERVKALEKLRKEEQQEFKKREDSLEQEFKLMETNLTAEIKLAAGKLNALEDWRLARIDLMKKFEDQEKQMAEQETRHKETLYETEKKLIIGKAKMQSELEKRLTELAQSFRQATSLRLADATRRTVRENLALRRELDELLAQCAELEARLRECQERERDAKLRAELSEAEASLALGKVVRQRRLMVQLLKEDQRASHELNRLIRSEAYGRYGKRAQEIAAEANAQVERRLCQLQEEVQLSQERATEAHEEARDHSRQLRKLEAVLAEARKIVVEAIEFQDEVEDGEGEAGEEEEDDACSACLLDAKEKLIQSLHDILKNYELPPDDTEDSVKTDPKPVVNLYEFGNLGIIPGSPDQQAIKSSEFEIISQDLKHFQEEQETTTSECSTSYSSDSQIIDNE